ncbi:MAG: Na+/H+ antiporter NhaA [Acidimicrobiia bacterium]|nr:Na+/H+ antiporter NhaA [Acidimicrobiia bacterium]
MAHPPQEQIHETWLHSDRLVPSRFVRPVVEFTRVEAAGGIVLLVAAVVALVWANSPFYESYFRLFNAHIEFSIGPVHIDESLKHIINDGLMALFFFVVGLEIKRELAVGELNSVKRAAMPAMAALGGMVVPALFFIAIVATGEPDAIDGWGIPMATDIAFSVGVIALLGSRVSVGAKLFLLALAIVDDVGAILVIAVFYTSDLDWGYLALAAGGIVLTYVIRRMGVWHITVYVVIGVATWYFFLESGVHATIAGVILGLLTPATSYYSDEQFRSKAQQVLDRWDVNRASPFARERLDHDALELGRVANASVSPLDRLEHTLHPWSSFVIVPLFALANAGVRFVGQDTGLLEAATSPVSLGVLLGLALGKPIGITLATWIGLRFNMGVLPAGTTMRTVVGLGSLAGIGFTVSLFITELAYRESVFADEAKLGIFLGSAVAGIVGYLILRTMRTPQQTFADAADELAGATEPA